MLHKHIARHTKKYVSHITKYLYERDTLFATIAVFVLLILIGMIPINFYVLNPMKLALKDFDFNDVAYSKLGKDEDLPPDKRITVINIGDLDREGIAVLIEKVNSYKPKVIGLDVYFDGEPAPTLIELLLLMIVPIFAFVSTLFSTIDTVPFTLYTTNIFSCAETTKGKNAAIKK